jgi:hypothetical protein
MTKGPARRSIDERLWSRAEHARDGCFRWTGQLSDTGYGVIGSGGASGVGGRNLYVHRVAYELVWGPIPPGLEIDHTCHTAACGRTGRDCPHRRCINPLHLVAVPHRENSIRDGTTNSGRNVMKTHCPAGHPYDEVNTRYERNRHGLLCRKCRACDRERARLRRARKRP